MPTKRRPLLLPGVTVGEKQGELESLTARTLDEGHALLAAGKGEVAALRADLDQLKRMIGVPVAGG